jgi:hypothetical protein
MRTQITNNKKTLQQTFLYLFIFHIRQDDGWNNKQEIAYLRKIG